MKRLRAKVVHLHLAHDDARLTFTPFERERLVQAVLLIEALELPAIDLHLNRWLVTGSVDHSGNFARSPKCAVLLAEDSARFGHENQSRIHCDDSYYLHP